MTTDAIEAILTRRSIRKHAPEFPERALIERVIEAGRHGAERVKVR